MSTDTNAVIALADFGFLRDTSARASYTVELTALQIAELERLVHGYTEALAEYNTLGPGKQSTLDTLNDVWVRIANALAL
jgi:hypothetical protein